jgi:hypothetical protein
MYFPCPPCKLSVVVSQANSPLPNAAARQLF